MLLVRRLAGWANLVVWPKVNQAHRRIILGSGIIAARGRVQRTIETGDVLHYLG